jgi:hypothetical protein
MGFFAVILLAMVLLVLPCTYLEVMGRIWSDRIRGMDLPLRFARDKLGKTIQDSAGKVIISLLGVGIVALLLWTFLLERPVSFTATKVAMTTIVTALTLLFTAIFVVRKHGRTPESAYAFFGARAAAALAIQFLVTLPVLLLIVGFLLVQPKIMLVTIFDIESSGAFREQAERVQASEPYRALTASTVTADKRLLHRVETLFGGRDPREVNHAVQIMSDFTGALAMGWAVVILFPVVLLFIWLAASPLESSLRRKLGHGRPGDETTPG